MIWTTAKETGGQSYHYLLQWIERGRLVSASRSRFLSGLVLLALFHNPCGLMYKELSSLLLAFLIVELLAFLFHRGLDFTLTWLGFPIIECFPFLLKLLRS